MYSQNSKYGAVTLSQGFGGSYLDLTLGAAANSLTPVPGVYSVADCLYVSALPTPSLTLFLGSREQQHSSQFIKQKKGCDWLKYLKGSEATTAFRLG